MTVAATETTVAGGAATAPLTPEWWVNRLYARLELQKAEAIFFDNYYTGEHPLPFLPPQAQAEFRRILGMSRTNYMGLVVDSTAERVRIEGFRFGKDSESDEDTWRIWQHNNLDALSNIAWLESLIAGTSYFMVAPNPKDSSLPKIWVESAQQCIVEYEPGTNRRERRAGLKVWQDDWTQRMNATLYLMVPKGNELDPNVEKELRIFKYDAPIPRGGGGGEGAKPQWVQRNIPGETWGDVGGMDAIPLVEIPNNPRLLTGGRSELWDLTDIQDRINKTVADRLITQDYGAFPQKWISAWPETDAEGNPAAPIDIGRDRAVTTDVAEARFGQWDAAPLDPYSLAKKEDVKDIAARSKTPAQYLLGDMSNVNGETLKASESGHISKVRLRMRSWGESAEEAVRLARTLAGLGSEEEEQMEVIFSNPEFRTEGELADAIVKMVQSRVSSIRQARVDWGYTEAQIRQLEQDDQKEALDPMLANALRPVVGTAAAAAGNVGVAGGVGSRDQDSDGVAGER